MHPNELEGRIAALFRLLRSRVIPAETVTPTEHDDDDRDAGVAVRRTPRYPRNVGSIAVPEPDDDRVFRTDTDQPSRLPIARQTK